MYVDDVKSIRPVHLSPSIEVSTQLFEHIQSQDHANGTSGYATWFTAGGAIRIVVRQLSQTWKLRRYDVIDDVITRKL